MTSPGFSSQDGFSELSTLPEFPETQLPPAQESRTQIWGEQRVDLKLEGAATTPSPQSEILYQAALATS